MSSITLDSLEDYDKIITPQHNCIYYVNGGEFVFLNGQDVTSDYATPDNVVNRIMGRPDVPIQEEQALTPVESISIDSESVEDIVEDDDIFLAVNVSPNTAYTGRIYATCSDTSKVTVTFILPDYGPDEPMAYSPVLGSAYTTVHYVLHGLEPTETPVTVTVKDQRSGKSSSAQFNVLSKKITGIELRQVDVEEGSSLNLYDYITITPDYADTSGLTWTSSNEDAVSMNSGTITGVSASDELATIKVVDANTGISSEMKCECYVPITEVTFSLADGYDFPNGRRPYAVLEEGDSSTVFYTVNPSNASVTKLTVQPSAESQGHVTYENEILSLGEVGDKTKGNLYYVDAIDERSSIKPTIDSETEISHNRLYISAWPVLDAITFEKTKVDIYGINKVINNYSDSCSWIPNEIYDRKTYPEDYRYTYPYPEVTWDDNLIDVTDFHTIYEDGGDFIITPKASATEDVTTKISVATNQNERGYRRNNYLRKPP